MQYAATANNQERKKIKPSYNQVEKLSGECQCSDSKKKHQPGINTQVVVEARVMLWICVEVTTAQKVDQIAEHPQNCRQPV